MYLPSMGKFILFTWLATFGKFRIVTVNVNHRFKHMNHICRNKSTIISLNLSFNKNYRGIMLLFNHIQKRNEVEIDWGCPRGVMVKAMDCGIVRKRVRTPVVLLRSLSGKYPWKNYEPPYPPSYGLNSTTTVLLGE